MTHRFKLGIIGAGMIVDQYLEALQKEPRAEIKSIYTRSKKTAQYKKNLYAEKFNCHPIFCNDPQTILADPHIDAIIIATPPHTHLEYAALALKNKKHILLEKPFALTVRQGQKLVALAKKHPQLVVCECSCRHTLLQPKYPLLKKLIATGIIGKPYYIKQIANAKNARPGIEYNAEAKWFRDRTLSGGGIAMDWGVYDFNFHLNLLNEKSNLKQLSGFLRNNSNEKKNHVEDQACITLTFTSGLTYTWERAAHGAAPAEDYTIIYGTKGALKFNYLTWQTNIVELHTPNNPLPKKMELTLHQHPGDLFALIKHFYDCLEKKTKPLGSLDNALYNLKIIETIYKNTTLS